MCEVAADDTSGTTVIQTHCSAERGWRYDNQPRRGQAEVTLAFQLDSHSLKLETSYIQLVWTSNNGPEELMPALNISQRRERLEDNQVCILLGVLWSELQGRLLQIHPVKMSCHCFSYLRYMRTSPYLMLLYRVPLNFNN